MPDDSLIVVSERASDAYVTAVKQCKASPMGTAYKTRMY